MVIVCAYESRTKEGEVRKPLKPGDVVWYGDPRGGDHVGTFVRVIERSESDFGLLLIKKSNGGTTKARPDTVRRTDDISKKDIRHNAVTRRGYEPKKEKKKNGGK